MAEIRCPLALAAKRHADRPALIDRDITLTWSQTALSVEGLAEILIDSGVKREDRVAIVENNRIELPILLLALVRVGATAVLLSPRHPDATLRAMAEKTGCRYHVIWSRGKRETRLPGLNQISLPPLSEYGGLIEAGARADYSASVDIDQPATIIYTSGSSASPKAVLLSYGNHYYNALGSNANLPVLRGDRWLLSLPLYHVGGLGILFRCMLGGATVVLADSRVNLRDQLERDHITHLSLVPTQLRRLLDDPRRQTATSTLKAILLGGAPVPTTLLTNANHSQVPVYLTYGLTEMSSQVATGSPSHPQSPKVLQHRILDIATDGEILVRGETLFKGYIENGSVVCPLDSDGWFHTGDIGSLSVDDSLTVLGRKDNMFVSGGENIQPEQIEQALTAIDGILDALVVPVEDREYGDRPVAFVRYDERISLSDPQSMMSESERFRFDYASLSGELLRTLPRYMIPVAIYPWPHNYGQTTMKADRRFLRQLAEKLYRTRK